MYGGPAALGGHDQPGDLLSVLFLSGKGIVLKSPNIESGYVLAVHSENR
jgi:hypothetical protein